VKKDLTEMEKLRKTGFAASGTKPNQTKPNQTTKMITALYAVAPIDMASTGTELAGYVAGAAGAGLLLFAAVYGVRVILRAFKSGSH
jgi:hypothetical protein